MTADCACELGLDSLRRTLSRSESATLDAHVSSCADCRMLLRINADLEPLVDCQPGDEGVIAAAAAGALSGQRGFRDSPVVGRSRIRGAALVLLVLVSGSAAAVAAGRQRGWLTGGVMGRLFPVRPAASISLASAPPARPRGRMPRGAIAMKAASPEMVSAGPDAVTVPGAAPSVEPPRDVSPVVAERSGAPAARRPPSHLAADVTSRIALEGHRSSARDLLEAATAARARGEGRRAADLFRRLQVLHPGTGEARVALVAAGQLLLDQRDFWGALTAFDAYRAQAPAGPLLEEALDGAARSLAGLQRFDEELNVWRELTTRFPRSAYLPRAMQRLAATR